MNSGSSCIWLVAFLVGGLAALPYLIWMIITAMRRRWRKLAVLCAVPPGIFIGLQLVTGALDRMAERLYWGAVFDVALTLPPPRFAYDTERDFNGDGYSFSVYALPDSVRTRFERADPEFLDEFPRRIGDREDWDREHWHEAPVDPSHRKYIEFAGVSDDIRKDTPRSRHVRDLATALSRKGTYYAFLWKEHQSKELGSWLANIDLFVVDLIDGRLYLINFNT